MTHTIPQLTYRLLGPSGLRVSELCLGAMTFGTEWGWGCPPDEAGRILATFREAGGNFIDTADFYTGGSSERILGAAIEADRDRWVLATKYSLHRDPHDPNAQGNHRKNLVRAVEGSLRRLRTDYLDLLWVHAWDFTLGEEDLLWALEALTRTGKILHVGLSDTPAWIVAGANRSARHRGWQGFTAIQLEYSLKERTAERDLLPMAAAHGLAVTAWSPLGSGALTGKYLDAAAAGTRLSAGYPVDTSEPTRRIASVIREHAARLGCTPAQLALAWLRTRRTPHVIPIIGARSSEQLRENLASVAVALDDDALRRLDDASRIEPGFPHAFLASDLARFALWGNVRERVHPR